MNAMTPEPDQSVDRGELVDQEDRDRDECDRDDADREEPVDVVGPVGAERRELLPDVLEVSRRREPPTHGAEALHYRRDRALGDGVQQLLIADVLDLVVLELTQ